MPAYKKTSKYSAQQNQQFENATFAVLANSTKPLTIAEICRLDPTIAMLSPQKMARVLNKLVEFGSVCKSKDKSGHMTYKIRDIQEEYLNIANREEEPLW